MLIRLLAAPLLAAALSAQLPYDHLVAAARVPSNTVPGLYLIDPANGVTTPIRTNTGSTLQVGNRTIAFDPVAPNVVYSATSLSTSIAATIVMLSLTGNEGTRTSLTTNLGGGQPFHLRYAPGFGMLVLGRGGTSNKMFLRNMTTGAVTPQPTANLLPPLASDIALIGSKAYASSEGDGSTVPLGALVEWDLAANTDRLVGNTYPPLTSLATFAGLLLAGDRAGNVHLIDPVTGSASLFQATGLGPITSIAVDSQNRMFVLVVNGSTSTVHDLANPAVPIHTLGAVLEDLKASPAAVPTLLTFGSGCTGSNSLVPAFVHAGMPGLGSTFTVQVHNALANTGGFLLLGSSRTADQGGPLPRPLDGLGLTGCTQYTDVLALAFVPIAGGIGTLPIAIPANPVLAGLKVPMQWLLSDPAANPFGATTSNGAEAHLR